MRITHRHSYIKNLKWFKVLRPSPYRLSGGFSSFDYTGYLPKGRTPGKWLTINKELTLAMCSEGFHVTHSPRAWGGEESKNRIFEVEVKGEVEADGSTKICCRKIRLVREIKRGTERNRTVRGGSYQSAKWLALRKKFFG